MKMTKIESARIVYEEKGHCFKVTSCFGCFNEKWCESKGCYQSDKYLSEKVALAEAYIKRHESKSKKKHQITIDEPKLTEGVSGDIKPEEPVKKWVKCIDNEHGLLPLIIGKVYETIFIRHGFICVLDEEGNERAFNERRFEFVEEPKPIKTVGIDNSDVIFTHETVKDCPVNSEIPQPVKFDDEVPEYVYIVYASVIRCYVVKGVFKKVIDKNLDGSIRETFTIYAVPITEERGEWLDAKGCYRTPEEALQVAKKLWNGDGK